MYDIKILVNTIEKVKKFAITMSKQSFDADLISDRYTVDAKSIMGIFSLDVTSPKKLRIYTDVEEEYTKFLDQISEFIV